MQADHDVGAGEVENTSGVADELVDDEDAPAPKTTYRIPLLTLEHVRVELARVYRDSRSGRIRSDEGSKLGYMLGQLKIVIEAIANKGHSDRIVALEAALDAVLRNGVSRPLLNGHVHQLSVAVPRPQGGPVIVGSASLGAEDADAAGGCEP